DRRRSRHETDRARTARGRRSRWSGISGTAGAETPRVSDNPWSSVSSCPPLIRRSQSQTPIQHSHKIRFRKVRRARQNRKKLFLWRGLGSCLQAIGLELLVESFTRFMLRLAPRAFRADKPMLRHIGLSDFRFRATTTDNLVIAIPDFLISIFHPHAGLAYDCCH